MTEINITEAGAVQFPMVRHAAEIGWTPLPPRDALAMRDGEAGVLEEALLHKLMTGQIRVADLDMSILAGDLHCKALGSIGLPDSQKRRPG